MGREPGKAPASTAPRRKPDSDAAATDLNTPHHSAGTGSCQGATESKSCRLHLMNSRRTRIEAAHCENLKNASINSPYTAGSERRIASEAHFSR